MSTSTARVCAYIDLSAIKYNAEQIMKAVSEDVLVIAVVKADGYGNGAVQIAHALENYPRIWGFAVATVDEALILRVNGIKKDILILGYTFPDDAAAVCKYDITPTIFRYEDAKVFSDKAAKINKTMKIHIAVDTGMSRIGYRNPETTGDECLAISKLPNIRIEGVFTHFARADETDRSITKRQFNMFQRHISVLKEKNIFPELLHCSNSAGIMSYSQYNMDAVRAGIVLYGLHPSANPDMYSIEVHPVMRLVSHVTNVKVVEAGTAIGYGGTFITDRMSVIATVPVGYADGYPRSLSNKGYVLIHGQRAAIRGKICMDQMMVDVTDIKKDVILGDEVVLIGKSGDEELTLEYLARLSGRFNYEFSCCITKRVPRVYLNSEYKGDGNVVNFN